MSAVTAVAAVAAFPAISAFPAVTMITAVATVSAFPAVTAFAAFGTVAAFAVTLGGIAVDIHKDFRIVHIIFLHHTVEEKLKAFMSESDSKISSIRQYSDHRTKSRRR